MSSDPLPKRCVVNVLDPYVGCEAEVSFPPYQVLGLRAFYVRLYLYNQSNALPGSGLDSSDGILMIPPRLGICFYVCFAGYWCLWAVWACRGPSLGEVNGCGRP